MKVKMETIKLICLNSITSITNALNIKKENIKIKNIEELAKAAHKKTYMDLKVDNYIKHYLILDTEKVLSIPVFAIKNKENKIIFRPCTIPFRRNIGLLEIRKKDNKKEIILYLGNVRRNLYC